jgi:hypothetical protein
MIGGITNCSWDLLTDRFCAVRHNLFPSRVIDRNERKYQAYAL